MRHKQRERGQVVLLVLVAMSIFLLAALGLAIDGANLYHQRQMAQTAADAAAQAGMISVFNGTNTSGPARFTAAVGSNWTCVSRGRPQNALRVRPPERFWNHLDGHRADRVSPWK